MPRLFWTSDGILNQTSSSTLVQVMTSWLLGNEKLAKLMLIYYDLDPKEQNFTVRSYRYLVGFGVTYRIKWVMVE